MTMIKPLLLLLLGALIPTKAEIRTFSGWLEASSRFIHFSDGYLVAPGYLDLSGMTFSTTDGNQEPEPWDKDAANDENEDQGGDDKGDGGGDDKDGGGGDRMLDDNSEAGSTVDIVFFHEPDDCAYTAKGCDWAALGVGVHDELAGGDRWCCSDDAIEAGVCQGGPAQYGRLIVNATLFKGQHRFIPVPPPGTPMESTVKYPKLEEPTQSGKYILIIANCNDDGRNVYVTGSYAWMSDHGYLPGEIFGLMYFLLALTVAYAVVFMWYGVSMKRYEEEIIEIQKWILATVFLGLLETFFRTGDYFVWNEDGTRFWFAMYSGVMFGVVKKALARCLMVMVGLGWGVVRDSLGTTMRRIVALGITYAGVSAARDIMDIIAVTDIQTLTLGEEVKLLDIVGILTIVVAAIDVIFILWILDALNGTMEELEASSQSNKLKRYLRLRCIILLAVLFAIVIIVYGLVDSFVDQGVVEQKYEWVVVAAMDLNFFFLLLAVSILWRPKRGAKEFAFVMELPAMNADDDEEEGGFDGVVPSAADDDDLEETNGAYRDDDDGMMVDDGVHT